PIRRVRFVADQDDPALVAAGAQPQRGARTGDTCAHDDRRRAHRAQPTGSKSILSRTPQSGQFQSSGTSDQGVPAGKPSRGAPTSSSSTYSQTGHWYLLMSPWTHADVSFAA